jgi:hypothetical protein
MIGCFFGKKIHELKTIKPQELTLTFKTDTMITMATSRVPSPALWLACFSFLFLLYFSSFLWLYEELPRR